MVNSNVEYKASKYNLCISEADLEQIRSAIREWGKSEEVVSGFSRARIHNHLEAWEEFVTTEWHSGWDVSEYNHDIGCRYWIQLAIEYSSPETRELIEEAVRPSDEIFKSKMRIVDGNRSNALRYRKPFKESAYFWEANWIYEGYLSMNGET